MRHNKTQRIEPPKKTRQDKKEEKTKQSCKCEHERTCNGFYCLVLVLLPLCIKLKCYCVFNAKSFNIL